MRAEDRALSTRSRSARAALLERARRPRRGPSSHPSRGRAEESAGPRPWASTSPLPHSSRPHSTQTTPPLKHNRSYTEQPDVQQQRLGTSPDLATKCAALCADGSGGACKASERGARGRAQGGARTGGVSGIAL
jgi:hypothetical protein